MEWYSFDKINETGCNYRIVIGERSNGKTYGFKLLALQNFFENNKQFMYVRRNVEEIRPKRMSQFFEDMSDLIIACGEKFFPQYDYVFVSTGSGKFDLYGYIEETATKVFIATMGFYTALNQARYDKSVPFPDVTLLCWDEFLTPVGELQEEFSLFINLISTVKRKRTDFIVYCLANTVNRNSKFLNAIGINVRDLKQGHIKCYQYYGERNVVNTVAVEYCKHYEDTTESEAFFTFGNPREMMIKQGKWEVDNYPTFDLSEFYTGKPARVGFVFIAEGIKMYGYLKDKFLFISDKRLLNSIDYITLGKCTTDVTRRKFNWNCGYENILNVERLILSSLVNGHIKYTDNLTGDDMRQFIAYVTL